MATYNFNETEKKWQKFWQDNGIFKVKENKDKKKYYVLDMFPYPSGSGLHVGHPRGYVATDVYARYMILKGYNVLHPMGFDSFGLPAENYAIKHKIHPEIAVKNNINRYKEQLGLIGPTYDWDREIVTSDPDYYKWTQWIFIQLFNKGLVYESYEPINWCPSCKTGLANEDLEDGKCERCGTQIEKKPMRQWVLKMTDYAERLLGDLKLVDWNKSIIDQQTNWIGKSEGVEIDFKIADSKELLKVFTTRADTLFGVTYVVVAPEHNFINEIESKIVNLNEVKKYINLAKSKSDLERTDLAKDKTGVEIKGIKAINPINGEEVPIFIADYVLVSYGTGAVMAVPAHDERDYEFAKKYNLPIKEVILNLNNQSNISKCAYIEDGRLINSGEFNGLTSEKAREEICQLLNNKGLGNKKVNYKMRDWVFSRQRYWGEPIPIVHCEKCGAVPMDEKDLPLKLPDVKSYEPTGTGESPLANISEWVNTKCPKCGGNAKRETNTMPQWAGSSWYYLRYTDPRNDSNIFDKSKEKYWMGNNGVDMYVGGAEHATRHLLYARFWHKFLYDIGVVSTKEPFYRLKNVGLILASDGRKMSKRWNNVINPDDVIAEYGADAFRMYEMFIGPFTEPSIWNTNGVKGVYRFLEKVNKYVCAYVDGRFDRNIVTPIGLKDLISETINKVTLDIESFSFNTAVSQMMILGGKLFELSNDKKNVFSFHSINFEDLKKIIIILSPFAPHLAEELWAKIGEKGSIFSAKWPEIVEVKKNVFNIAVMVNGKKRSVINIDSKLKQDDVVGVALKEENVKKYIPGGKYKKVIYIPGKIISFVI